MTRLEDSVSRINAGWYLAGKTARDRCRDCRHCGTAREIGVVCKHPHNDFCETELDAVCKRFEGRKK